MKKRNGRSSKEKKMGRKERAQAFSQQELIEFMKGEERPLLLKEILRQLGLKNEEKQQTK